MKKIPTMVSLFTGAGGLDLGMEAAGFKTVLAAELEETYCQTLLENQALGKMNKDQFDGWFSKQLSQKCYKKISNEEKLELRNRLLKGVGKHNHLRDAKIVSGDIRDLSSKKILEMIGMKSGELDIVVGGPPCQPFSRAGKRQTVETSDGRLFKEFVRVVNDLKPRWFLFENVKGLAQSKTEVVHFSCVKCGNTFYGTLDEREAFLEDDKSSTKCTKCGSRSLESKTIKKSGGSLDLILEEFTRVGYKCEFKLLNSADYGVPQTRERLFIVGSRDGEDFTWPEPTHEKKDSVNSTNSKKKPWIGMFEAIWTEGHFKYGKVNKSKALLWVKNVVRPHDEPVTWSLDRPSPTIGAHQSAKLAFAPKGVPEDQIFRQQWHTLGRRQGDTPPVFVEHEYLSDRELLLLQSFPEYWYLHGTRMERAFQIGNAVPPKFAEVIGRTILNADRRVTNVTKHAQKLRNTTPELLL